MLLSLGDFQPSSERSSRCQRTSLSSSNARAASRWIVYPPTWKWPRGCLKERCSDTPRFGPSSRTAAQTQARDAIRTSVKYRPKRSNHYHYTNPPLLSVAVIRIYVAQSARASSGGSCPPPFVDGRGQKMVRGTTEKGAGQKLGFCPPPVLSW